MLLFISYHLSSKIPEMQLSLDCLPFFHILKSVANAIIHLLIPNVFTEHTLCVSTVNRKEKGTAVMELTF